MASRSVGTLVALLLIAGSAHAAETTWYLHDLTGPDGSDSYLDFLPPAGEEDQTATSEVPTTLTSMAKGPLAETLVATGADSSATVFFKSWNNGPAPATEVTVTLLDGENALASGSLTQDILLGEIVQYDIPLELAVDEIPAGTTVGLEVAWANADAGTYNPFAYPRGVSEEHTWSFTLGVAPAGGGPATGVPVYIDEALEGTFVTAEHTTEAPAAEVRNYTWRVDGDEVHVTGTIEPSNGSASLSVTDGAGAVLFDQDATDLTEINETLTDLGDGNWTIQFVLDEFVGSFSVDLEAVVIEDGDDSGDGDDGDSTTTSATSGTTSGTSGGNGTAPPTTESDDSPLFALPLLVAGLALVALRRRLH